LGFARVVTDLATFAYVGDVFVIEAYRGRGLSKWPWECMVEHPDLKDLRRWHLVTRDAQGLYAKFGFAEPPPGKAHGEGENEPVSGRLRPDRLAGHPFPERVDLYTALTFGHRPRKSNPSTLSS